MQLGRVGLVVDEVLRPALQAITPVHVKLQEAMDMVGGAASHSRVILRMAVHLERRARISDLSGAVRVKS